MDRTVYKPNDPSFTIASVMTQLHKRHMSWRIYNAVISLHGAVKY